MATSSVDDDSSEDEVFFGPSTLKEIRARLLPKEVRRAMKYTNKQKCINGSDSSITIIEMHSEPEMGIQNDLIDSPNFSTDNSYLRLLPNDSFIRLEQQVADCCISVQRNNNTLEVDNIFLNESPVKGQQMINNDNIQLESRDEQNGFFNNKTVDISFQQGNNPKIQAQDDKLNEIPKEKTNRVTHDSENIRMEEIGTVQLKTHGPCEKVSTQKKKINNTDIFKTPISIKKDQVSLIKNSLSKVNAYQHVVSPIALYIKNPQTPLIRNTKPRSFIPTMKKYPTENKISNKENMQLQPIACGTPKRTAMVHNNKKLTQSDWSKKQTPSKFVLRKNAPGVVTSTKKPFVPQDDSIVNLSLKSQADV